MASMRASRVMRTVLILSILLFTSASGARETFSQKRQRLLEEKRRLQEVETVPQNDITTTTTTISPRLLTFDDRLKMAALNLAADKDVELMAEMNVHLNWEPFLTPVPTSLGILATLMMAAGQTDDFRLDEQKPTDGFRYMKHADSFRRSLLQISHQSYDAFLAAHVNMNRIRLSTLNVPDYMKAAVDILATGDIQVIESQLHRPLSVVRKAIKDNLIWSLEMATKFDRLANLTDEVHLASVSSRDVKQTRKIVLIARQTTAKMTADRLQEFLDNLQNRVKSDLGQYDRFVNDMVEAYRSIPTKMDSFFMDVAQFVIADVLGAGKSRGSGDGPTSIQNSSSSDEPTDPCVFQHLLPIFTIYARSQTLSSQYPTLKSIDSVDGRYNATEDAKDYAVLLRNTSDCRPIKDVVDTGTIAIEKMHRLAHVKEMPDQEDELFLTWRENEFIHVRLAIENFVQESSALSTIARQVPVTDIFSGNVTNPGTKSRVSSQKKADAYYQIALHKESLRVLRGAMDRNWKQIIKKTEESIHILNEIHSWKTEQIGFERAVEMLEMGMAQMSQLKENWALLVRFFVGLSHMIETIFGTSLNDFTQQLETTANSTSFKISGQLKDFVIANIRTKTSRAIQTSTIVSGMASTYCRISTDYLMPRVHRLDAMMKLEESSTNFAVDHVNLLNSCVDDSLKIKELIGEEKMRLMEKIESRFRQIRKEYAFLDELKTQANGQDDIDDMLSYY